jgi:hypothetical protein
LAAGTLILGCGILVCAKKIMCKKKNDVSEIQVRQTPENGEEQLALTERNELVRRTEPAERNNDLMKQALDIIQSQTLALQSQMGNPKTAIFNHQYNNNTMIPGRVEEALSPEQEAYKLGDRPIKLPALTDRLGCRPKKLPALTDGPRLDQGHKSALTRRPQSADSRMR